MESVRPAWGGADQTEPLTAGRGIRPERSSRWRLPGSLGRYRLRLRLYGGAGLIMLLVVLATVIAVGGLREARSDLELLDRSQRAQTRIEHLRDGAQRYLRVAPRNYPDYYRDTETYYVQLQADLGAIDRLLQSVGVLLATGPGRDPLVARATDAAVGWSSFQRSLAVQLGDDPDEPRLEWAARHIAEHGAGVEQSTGALVAAAQARLDRHLGRTERIAGWALPAVLGLAVIGMLLLAASLHRRVRATLVGCRHIADGEFGHQIEERGVDEFSALNRAVNRLSLRMQGVLGVLDRMQRASDRADALTALVSAIAPITVVRGIALYERAAGESEWTRVESTAGDTGLPERLPPTAIEPAQPPGIAAEEPGRRGPADNAHPAPGLTLPNIGSTQYRLLFDMAHGRRIEPDAWSLLCNIAPLLGNALHKSALTEQLMLVAISGLSTLAESRDPETGDHLLRMSLYARVIAETLIADGDIEVDSPNRFVRDIHRLAPMHDIGKVGIPDAILLKPGPLDDEQRRTMNQHTVIGGHVLRGCALQLPAEQRGMFELAAEIAEAHHERFDGRGYPHGLHGADIPLSARIVAAADVLDALTSRRPYKQAWPFEQGLQTIESEAGAHFDPLVTAAMRRSEPRLRQIYDRYKHV